jgi:hypothetical protein
MRTGKSDFEIRDTDAVVVAWQRARRKHDDTPNVFFHATRKLDFDTKHRIKTALSTIDETLITLNVLYSLLL